MALRLRRDVQKSSYYVWFLGAEEAKGLRGHRVINSVLPYLIDRSRQQEPLKVTLQVSHKGIKILQGSSKHFIPHSAITSSVLTEDIVACVLLLYNPATKCPLHVHGYRCDSESTAEALHQQLQILINRPENQKRFEELETRLGILPPLPSAVTAAGNSNKSNAAHLHAGEHNGHKQSQQRYQSQSQQKVRRHDSSPKRFSSSLGSDTGNSTRESECSEEHSGGGNSPISRSPPVVKALPVMPPLPSPELFDSLAAELRAKLNGNGPPLLLPPRDYDTVHRSKGNLAAIELRRCRNELIVGGPNSPGAAAVATSGANKNQVSSRGSSGIGSDLAPSPERQDLNSSSDDDHWTNEADNSVIALKPSQIALERSKPIMPLHSQLNRKSAIQPPDDSYLRDLPSKPYNGRHITAAAIPKTSTSKTAWNREDEIKPIIMRPADYDAKFNRVLQSEQSHATPRTIEKEKEHSKLRDTDKYNEINRLLNKKLSLEREDDYRDDFEDGREVTPPPVPAHAGYRKENLTDKQKFMEYTSSKKASQQKVPGYIQEPPSAARHRFVEPTINELAFEQSRNKYAAVHRGPNVAHSPERIVEIEHRTTERPSRRERQREEETRRISPERKRENYSRSNERNPYREPESIPYIESMEKMIKSTAMRYKSLDEEQRPKPAHKLEEPPHTKLSQRNSKPYAKHLEEEEVVENERIVTEKEHKYKRRSDYAHSAASGGNLPTKDRYRDAKDKFRALERGGSRFDLRAERDENDYKPRRRGSMEQLEPTSRIYDEWSDEEPLQETHKNRSKSRERWQQNVMPKEVIRELSRELARDNPHNREREPVRENKPREMALREREKEKYSRTSRSDAYRPEHEYDMPPRETRSSRDINYDRHQRDYSPEMVNSRSRKSQAEQPRHHHDYRSMEKHRADPAHAEMYPSPTPPSSKGSASAAAMSNAKSLSNLTKTGYRHSYAEPVFARNGVGRVGLAAVNPY